MRIVLTEKLVVKITNEEPWGIALFRLDSGPPTVNREYGAVHKFGGRGADIER
jgi:hypothetical protein